MISYTTEGTCSTRIHFELKDGKISHVSFEGGCDGNLKAISRLVEGMNVSEVAARLKGIDCEGKGTSCADQLAKAVETAAK